MSEAQQWAFPDALQPKAEETQFDLARAFNAVVLVRAEVPPDGYTVSNLGTERGGYGVVIREDGLVLTIGYLINEASQIWLTTNRGAVVAGYRLAYDQATGFGLIQPLGKLDAPHLPRGLASDVKVDDSAFVIGHGGSGHALKTRIIGKREFAGYWEYLLDEALFTAPAHPQWGGAALIGADGRLAGIGSLLVQEKIDAGTLQGNMIVPIDLLKPILDDFLTIGRANRPPRPWLGLYATEVEDKVVIVGLADNGPAQRANLKTGDLVVSVGGVEVDSLAGLFRRIWAQGEAGVEVPLLIYRDGRTFEVKVPSSDRTRFLKRPSMH
jgi:S1-C subfamily serine protease